MHSSWCVASGKMNNNKAHQVMVLCLLFPTSASRQAKIDASKCMTRVNFHAHRRCLVSLAADAGLAGVQWG